MAPAAQAILLCDGDDVRSLLSDLGVDLRLDDRGAGVLTDRERARLESRACQYGSSRVKMFCCPRYAEADLATSWVANEWATGYAAWWLCHRRNNPAEEAIRELVFGEGGYKEELERVKSSDLQIPDIGTRHQNDSPAASNQHLDARYRYRQLRTDRIDVDVADGGADNPDYRARYPEI